MITHGQGLVLLLEMAAICVLSGRLPHIPVWVGEEVDGFAEWDWEVAERQFRYMERDQWGKRER